MIIQSGAAAISEPPAASCSLGLAAAAAPSPGIVECWEVEKMRTDVGSQRSPSKYLSLTQWALISVVLAWMFEGRTSLCDAYTRFEGVDE
eukprot:2051575-Pyramimonas_sp.AAC.1